MIPSSPVQRTVAWLIEFFGCDLFFIPGMHYRFNFPEQRAHIDTEFARALSPHKDPEQRQADITPVQDHFSAFPERLGVTPATITAIEASHIECLELLDAHFLHHPYLLGGHPSTADFGLIGPLYAHLGRDPVPASLMKNIAPNVYRWTERMFEPALVDGEFIDTPYAFPIDDQIPETLIPFIEYLFRDCGPQVQSMIDTFSSWAGSEPQLTSGTLVQIDSDVPGGAYPNLGEFEFNLRGTTVKTQAFANVVYHFQQVLDVIDALDDKGRANFDTFISRTGGSELMSTKPRRRIKSEHYQLLLE
ncbi:MAG: glutathione S-transferase [Gammaproteobacteria bacterium]|jgi:glutathione S-transferase